MRRKLHNRPLAKMQAPAEEEWRKRIGRPMTAAERERVLRRYPGGRVSVGAPKPGSPLGFEASAWEAACLEVRRYLIRVALRNEGDAFASFADVAGQVSAISFSRATGSKPGVVLGALLRSVDQEETAAGRPMLSALVADDRRDRAHSFAPAARKLGRVGADDEAIWLAETIAVHDYWAEVAIAETLRDA